MGHTARRAGTAGVDAVLQQVAKLIRQRRHAGSKLRNGGEV